MRQSNAHRLVLLALFLLGISSQVMQAWLVRETLVVFYGNEASLGAFFGSWLFWIAIGSLSVIWLRRLRWVQEASLGLSTILLALPPLLIMQVIGVRSIRLLLETPSIELVPLGELFPAVALLTLPGAMALGLAFPLACKALGETEAGAMVRGISWLYVAEAAGALLGGVLFTFVLLPWLGLWQGLGVLSLGLALLCWRLRPRPSTRLGAALIGLLGLLLLTPSLSDRLQTRLEVFRFHTLQPGLELLDALETRYGHVAYARLGGQISVVRDGRIATSFPRPEAVQQTAAYVYAQGAGARRLLLFGSFASGLAAELLRYPIEHIDLVLQDRRAFEHLRPYLPPGARAALDDPRLQLHFIDGRRYLREYHGAPYDLVLTLDADPSNAHSNRYFTREFYTGIHKEMTDRGVLCTRVSSASNYLGGTVRSYAGSVYRTLSDSFAQLAVQPGDVQLLCASRQPGQVSEDPAELERRYLSTRLDKHTFPATSFQSLLPAERIQYLHYQFQQHPGALNSDNRPITFYLNMLLWARYTASSLGDGLEQLRSMGPWPYLVPALVFLALWLLRTALEGRPTAHTRRQAGSFSLALLGLVAMALQLVVLFDYQAHVGFMFERIALINALFMTGLALGTGLIGQAMIGRGRPESWLIALLLLVAAILALTPLGLGHLATLDGWVQEAGYLAVSCLFGLLTGAGFPLGVRLAQGELHTAVPTGGLSEAADSLGGALGGLVTGALLVPLLGISGTCSLLVLLSLIILTSLVYARWAPAQIAVLASRGRRSFPWSGLGWVLAFLVLVQYGWDRVQQEVTVGPQVHFEQGLLARVSGSQQFRGQEQPYPLYLGWDNPQAADTPADTASLSSMAVAPEVRGYAGPINLLVSLDSQGRLRGVQYLDSDETPSYIAGIGDWLRGLAGQELADAPLDIQRVDAISGATVSSQAALTAINRTVAAAGKTAFRRSFAPTPDEQAASTLWTPRFLATFALLLASIPIYLSGSERARLGLQAASLVVLGLWLNSLVTEVDLVNVGLGHLASLTENPQRWLLLGFVVLSGLLFGQLWCGYLCPFGAAQEFLSRLGRLLGLRRYVRRPLGVRLRFIKFILLALMLSAVLWFDDPFWASFNPMQHAFAGGHIAEWAGVILAVSLAGAVIYVRFWCRYFCPFGAFLALSNKFSLLQSLAPQRRIEHCDLGVRHEFDIDCIRCNRCLTGRDTHVHRQHHD